MSASPEDIQRYTVSPAGAPCEAVQDAVLVPYGCDLAEGFERARRLRQDDRLVRLVGNGVTLEPAWPAWVREDAGILLTELAAYRDSAPVEASRRTREEIHSWLSEMLGEVVPGIPSGDLFYLQSSLRLFLPMLEAAVHLPNLVEQNRGARFYCAAESSPVRHMLAAVAGDRPKEKGSLGWGFKMVTLGVAAMAGTAWRQLRRYRREAASRAALRERRDMGRELHPQLWLALLPDWSRFNRHVLESVAAPVMEQQLPVGVMFSGPLMAGMRVESELTRREGGELWPALGLLNRYQHCVIEQGASAESMGDFLRVLRRMVGLSLRTIFRLATYGPQVGDGSAGLRLEALAWTLAKLVTQDLFNALAAESAARKLVRRHAFRGTQVVFAGSAQTGESVADRILQGEGAITTDFLHGYGGETWLTFSPSQSSQRAVWTRADAASLEGFGQKVVVAGMPRTVVPRPRPAKRRVENVLIMSNYVHRDQKAPWGYPLLPFQMELLRTVALIRSQVRNDLRFRWRPHPADDERMVERALEENPGIELSRGRALQEDADWADIIFSSQSSVAIESLLAGVPVFVHVAPLPSASPHVNAFDAARRFWWARELVPRFASCVQAVERGDPDALAPERRARIALFGASGEPGRLDALLWPALRPSSAARPR
jgi:hypothetical protein